MQHKQPFRLKALTVMLAGAFAVPAMAEEAAKDAAKPAPLKAGKIEVISTTPLPSLGLPLEQIPATVQVVKGEEMQKQNSLSIADYMTNNMPGVTVNDTQNNPYQPDISFRGFSASPLLGTPQGLSVFYDGVRLNEPFGDVVNWDLIPINALAGMQLIPGSNPVFGLNTLGGALSLQTKSGRTHTGGALEAYAGSWGRKAASAEYGGVSKDGSVDYFFSANSFTEDGWRDHSPTDVRQLFGKVGWQNETTKINLSYTGADNDLIGNGLTPQRFLRTLGRDSIQTRPDQTINRMSLLNLTGSHWLSDETMFSGNVYYRHAKTLTLNGDGNDDIENFAPADCVAGADPEDAEEGCSGALNRTTSKRRGAGFAGQFTFNQDFLGRKNQFIVGGGFDYGRTNFTQNTEYGLINATRGVDGIGVFGDEGNVKLRGVNKTWSLFATNTHSFNERWHLTTSARYNHTTIDNKDGLVPVGDPATLTAEHSYNRINPAIGLNFTPSKALTVYGTYNEASRAPTSIELGCANPAQPCKLPNAFAGDPPLEQVVSKTYEGGLRGQFDNGVRWSTAAYVTNNYDDILFAAAPGVAGQGYFKNFGQTRRKGLEASLLGSMERFTWSVGYSLVDARYRSSESIASEVNSAAIDTDGDGEGDTLRIRSGDRIPGIPMHQLKMRGVFSVTPKWTIGANIIAFTDQYARGNENNAHRPDNADFFGDGKVSGYAVVNLDTRYHLGNGWQIFAKAVNIFDREYNNAGLLGASLFNANGTFNGGEDAGRQALYAPGAPRAGWIGVRWEFGGAKSSGIDTN